MHSFLDFFFIKYIGQPGQINKNNFEISKSYSSFIRDTMFCDILESCLSRKSTLLLYNTLPRTNTKKRRHPVSIFVPKNMYGRRGTSDDEIIEFFSLSDSFKATRVIAIKKKYHFWGLSVNFVLYLLYLKVTEPSSVSKFGVFKSVSPPL